MQQHIIKNISGVHDNEIIAYHVDMVNHVLTMETVFEKKEKIDIIFTDWLTHHFEDLLDYNIIYDIQQITIDHYIQSNKKRLEKSRQYGFQAQCLRWGNDSFDDLKKYLSDKKYHIYHLSASLGMSGTIIAKDITITTSPMA